MANITGTNGNDTLAGTNSADTLSGLAGADELVGHGANDVLYGGDGGDTLVGGEGADTLDGGAGTDRVFYFRENGSSGISADLDTGLVTDTWGTVDTLISVEWLYGSALDDTIFGTTGVNDLLFGNNGNDNINGRSGNDVLVGDQGSDTLSGGAGVDQVAYDLETGTGGVSVNLATGTATDTWGNTDTLFSIERILGSDRNDTLLGSAGGDFFYGRDGADYLETFAGNDTLVGDQGNDTLKGGLGGDLVAYDLETGTLGVNVDLRAGTATDTWGDTDTLVDIEYVSGSNNNDTLLGTDAPGDRFFGRDGDDYMDGRDGNDLYYTGAGNDTIMVGGTIADARDTIVVNGLGNKTVMGFNSEGTAYGHHLVFEINEAVVVNLATGIATSANSYTDFTQALYFLEVNGTMYDDYLIGGNPLHDYLEWYTGNQGNDTIDGGTGTADTVIYEPEEEIGAYNFVLGRQEYGSQGIVVNLATGVATDTFGYTDTLINIDHVRATNFDDNIIGSDEDNAFWGLKGNDTLNGGAGNDVVHYGEDYLRGGTAGVTVNLTTGIAIDGHGDTDTLISIEHVNATNSNDFVTGNADANRLFGEDGNDTLIGNGGADVLVGGAGADDMRGGDGDDELVGGAGNDTMDGGLGFDLVRYRDDTAGVNVNLQAQQATDGYGNTDTLISIERAHGSDLNDTLLGDGGNNELSGFAGDDTLTGNGGNDTLLGGAGNDTLHGGDGDDEIWGQAGNDSIDGGAGADLVRYRDAASGITVSLSAGTAQDGAGGTDTLFSIENVHGSEFGDSLSGSALGNELSGFSGNDTIDGLAGNDTLLGGGGADILRGGDGDDRLWGEAGNDTLDGGAGFDILRHLSSTGSVTVDLVAGTAQDGFGTTDVLIGIEGAHGSSFNDTLRGDAGGNELSGFDGNDLLEGRAGSDTLLGGGGNDSLSGGDGDDELWGGTGFDTLDGGAGTDLVRYSDDVAGVTVDLGSGLGTDGAGNTDVLTSIENIDGSGYGDGLTGGTGANRLFGFGGNDTLSGRGGNDTIQGGTGNDSLSGGDGDDEIWGEQGNDTIDGGSGIDLIRYRGATGGTIIDLATGVAQDGHGSQDLLSGIENAHGSDFDDVMRGDANANELRGFLGNDTLTGKGGNDTLLGDAGNDSISGGTGDDEIWGGAGADSIDGGAGRDLARYLDSAGSVTVNLATGVAQDGFGSTDALTGIEGVHGSEQADTLIGSTGDNELSGFGGNDLLQGSLGNDTLIGGAGNDTLEGGGQDDQLTGGTGADRLDGGDGIDVVRYREDAAGVHVNLISGQALDGSGMLDTLIAIENAHGSDYNDTLTGNVTANELSGFAGDDTLTGNGGNDTLLGGAGNDSLSGGANNDELWGEAGNDTIDGGAGTDLIRYRNATSGVTVDLATGTAQDGDGGTDSLANIEYAHGSDSSDLLRGSAVANELSGFDGADTLLGFDGNDTLLGGAGDDSLSGGNGDDELWGNAGNDTIDGGAGANDLVRYREDPNGVVVNLTTGTATDGYGNTDTLLNIEDVHSSDRADVLRGSAGANRLFGFAGNDTIFGEGGADVLLGDGGADSILGGDGDDEIWGSAGADTLDGGAGTDVARYRDAISTVTVNLETGTAQDGFGSTDSLIAIENVHGSDFGDNLTGDGGANQLFGFAGQDMISGGLGNDTILGGDGADSLTGGGGNDEIWGEAGDDSIDGGDGTDLVRFRGATSALTVDLVLGTSSGEGADILRNIENIDGSDYNDLIIGDSGVNVFSGFGGNDTLIGNAGNDVLSGRQGSDRYEFFAGDGNDVVNDLGDGTVDRVVINDYFAANASVFRQNPTNEAIVINFGATGDQIVLANTLNASHTGAIEEIEWADGTVWSHADLIANMDQVGVVDSAGPTPLDNLLNRTPNDDVTDALAGNDLVRGLGGNDNLSGSEGNDSIYGGIGNDSLYGGIGDDLLEGGPGDDFKDGGEGFDTAVYGVALADAVVTVNAGIFTINSHLGTDTVSNIESFRFTDQTLTLAQMTAIGQNAAPVSTLPTTLTSTEGAVSIDFGQYFTDPESQTLSWSFSGLPGGLTVQQSGQFVVSGTVEGSLTPYIVTITATDPLNGRVTDMIEWTINNVNAAPTGGASIAGTAAEGATLTAVTTTLADVDGLGELSYAWLRDGNLISGAATQTYTLTAADIGAQIGLRVSYTDAFGTAEQVTAAPTAAVANVNVAPTGGVSIAGNPTEGQTLTAVTNTLADGDGLGTFSLQWQRDGVAVEGATGTTYVPGNDDVGTRITLNVSYTDAQGTAENVTSPATIAVRNVNDAPTGGVTIDGGAAEGQTLSADISTLTDADGLGVPAYQWLRAGVVITGATSPSYLLTADDIGATIAVRVRYTDGHGTTESLTSAATAAVVNTNGAPAGAVVIQGAATQGATLTADTSTLSDPDGVGSLSYQWLRDGAIITGATASSYVLALTDIGTAVSVRVSYTDGGGVAESMTSTATAAIAGGNLAPTGSVNITGDAIQTHTLVAETSTLADGNGLGSFNYQWLRDGAAITGATGATYTLVTADIGTQVSLRVSYTDGLGTAESVTSTATTAVANANDAPTGSVLVSGTATQGETLTADPSGLADADGLGSFSYQWLRDGVEITGATAATYTTTQDDVTRGVSVRVSYTDGFGAAEAVTSGPTAAVQNINDAPVGVPVITGNPARGQVLSIDGSGISDADGLNTFFYEWFRDGVKIVGELAQTYTVVAADDNAAITARVNYTDGFGTVEGITSAAVNVNNANDAPTGSIPITGLKQQGETLTADVSGFDDPDGLGPLSFQWLREGVEITGATAANYTTTQADVGSGLSVRVSYTDLGGTAESVTTGQTLAIANVNDLPVGAPVITGTPARGQVLSIDGSGISDADGLNTFFYGWFRDGVKIQGEFGSTYMIVAADDNASITAQVVYTDGFGTVETVTSAGVTVGNANDAPTGSIPITGLKQQGETLTADVSGFDDPDGLGPLSFQWLREGVEITGATAANYTTTQADVGSGLSVRVSYTDLGGTAESVTTGQTLAIANVNDLPVGAPILTGTAMVGQALTIDGSGVSDADGLGRLFYGWYRDDVKIAGQFGQSYTLTAADAGASVKGSVTYTDGFGTVENVSSTGIAVAASGLTLIGTAGNDRLEGGIGTDSISGLDGNDTLIGNEGNDTLLGGDGADTLIGGLGDDFIFGGATEADLRDVMYGGAGNDNMDGGYGNDEMRGDDGNDTMAGSYGADTVIGGAGDDVLTGAAYGDLLYGGDGADFINGGFGYDRVNGGAGADKFYHLGVAGHGSDWIQDYNSAEGDVLMFGGGAALASDFLIQRANTASAGAAGVDEIFVTQVSTGNLLWALVDGDAQAQINIQIQGQVFDLLA